MTSLIELLRQQFPNAQFDVNDGELKLGSFTEWDSLSHFNFLMRVEEAFDTRFSMDEMASLKSLAAIRSSLIQKGKKP